MFGAEIIAADHTQKAGGRWENHTPSDAPPRPEYLGPAQGQVTMLLHLKTEFGVAPRSVVEQIERMARDGVVAPLMFGSQPVSQGDWFAEAPETEHVWVYGDYLDYARMTITFKEYY